MAQRPVLMSWPATSIFPECGRFLRGYVNVRPGLANEASDHSSLREGSRTLDE